MKRKKMTNIWLLQNRESFSLFSSLLEVISQREKVGGFDSIICFLCSALSKPVPQSGETLTISTFSDVNPTELDKYEFLSPMNNDFLLEYVSI